jgi:hypothetical protein
MEKFVRPPAVSSKVWPGLHFTVMMSEKKNVPLFGSTPLKRGEAPQLTGLHTSELACSK